MKKIAQIISNVFSPLLVPTWGVVLALSTSFLSLASGRVKVGVTIATLIITCLLPAIIVWLMWKLGKVSDPGLNQRTERTIPYLITVASYIACGFYLWRVNAPTWLLMFMAGGCAAAIVDVVVNRWWKISAHMTAMGGLMALACRICADSNVSMGSSTVWWVAAVAILCGAVGTSRIYLNRHTPLQVAAGFAVGFICVLLLTLI